MGRSLNPPRKGNMMSIKTKEDAETYTKAIIEGCQNLTDISVKAGMYSHAAIFQTITAAFCDSTDEIQTISDMMGMYIENRLMRYGEYDGNTNQM